MTVGQLLAGISSYELSEWIALYKIEAGETQRAAMDAKAKLGASSARKRARGRR